MGSERAFHDIRDIRRLLFFLVLYRVKPFQYLFQKLADGSDVRRFGKFQLGSLIETVL